MANIKITELNEILKKDNADVLPIVDVSANETKKIAIEDLLDKNIALIAVTDTEPAECSTGDKYYNTTTKKIYTAINTDVWDEDGEDPISGILYIVYDEQASYSWDGTDLVSVGGGKEDIVIDNTQPTDPDVKLWIDTGEIGSRASEITNEYSTSTGKGYSANYINNLHTYSTDEIRIGTWIDGKPLYRKVIETTTPVVSADGTLVNKSVPVSVSDVDFIYIDKAIIIGGGNYNANAVVSNMAFTYGVRFEVNSSNITIYGNSTTFSNLPAKVVIEYTKTTD